MYDWITMHTYTPLCQLAVIIEYLFEFWHWIMQWLSEGPGAQPTLLRFYPPTVAWAPDVNENMVLSVLKSVLLCSKCAKFPIPSTPLSPEPLLDLASHFHHYLYRWSVDVCRFWVTVDVTVRTGVSRGSSLESSVSEVLSWRRASRWWHLQNVATVWPPSDEPALDWTQQWHETTPFSWRSCAALQLQKLDRRHQQS